MIDVSMIYGALKKVFEKELESIINSREPAGQFYCKEGRIWVAANTHASDMHKLANGYAFRIVRLDPDGRERESDGREETE